MPKKKKFQCPHCEHKSARRSNMGVHITRWHDGQGLPIQMEHDNFVAYQRRSKSKPYLKRVKGERDHLDENTWSSSMRNTWEYPWSSSIRNTWEYPWSAPGNNTNLEANDLFGNLFRMIQVTNNLKQIIGNSRPIRHEQPITIIPQEDNFDRILGYRAIACNKCLTIIRLPILQGQGGVMSNVRHNCSQNRINETLRYETNQRANVASSIEKNVHESLLRACKEWAKDEVYLRAFPTIGHHSSSTTIDIANIDKENWLIRTINKFQTSVNDAELLEFLQMAQDQTCTFVYINNSSNATHNSCYLIGVIRNP